MELTDQDIETLAYTLLGEAEGEGVEGMVAVANVIRNRAEDDSGLFADDPVSVVLQPGQFTTNDAKRGNQTAVRSRNPVGSDGYNTATQIVREIFLPDVAPDITDGTLFYHSTKVTPYWAGSVKTEHGTKKIGAHTFYPTRDPEPINGALLAIEAATDIVTPNILNFMDGGTIGAIAVPGNPNRKKKGREEIKGIVFHHTGGTSLSGAMVAGQKGGIQSKTSAHFYIDTDGTIYRYAGDDEQVNHIRESSSKYRTDKGLASNILENSNTIGVEVVAPDSKHFTQAQKEAAAQLATWLSKEYNISSDLIVGHGEIQGSAPNGNKQADEGIPLADFTRKSIAGLIPPGSIPEVGSILDTVKKVGGNIPSPLTASPEIERKRKDYAESHPASVIDNMWTERQIENDPAAQMRAARVLSTGATWGVGEPAGVDVTPILDWQDERLYDMRPRYDALYSREHEAMVLPGDDLQLRPLNPREQITNPDGTHSTERLTTWQMPDGSWVNVPSLWMSASGPYQFDEGDEQGILSAMQRYEADHGPSFLRFKSVGTAEAYAQARSELGGAAIGPQLAIDTSPIGVAGGARLQRSVQAYTTGGAQGVVRAALGASVGTMIEVQVKGRPPKPKDKPEEKKSNAKVPDQIKEFQRQFDAAESGGTLTPPRPLEESDFPITGRPPVKVEAAATGTAGARLDVESTLNLSKRPTISNPKITGAGTAYRTAPVTLTLSKTRAAPAAEVKTAPRADVQATVTIPPKEKRIRITNPKMTGAGTAVWVKGEIKVEPKPTIRDMATERVAQRATEVTKMVQLQGGTTWKAGEMAAVAAKKAAPPITVTATADRMLGASMAGAGKVNAVTISGGAKPGAGIGKSVAGSVTATDIKASTAIATNIGAAAKKEGSVTVKTPIKSGGGAGGVGAGMAVEVDLSLPAVSKPRAKPIVVKPTAPPKKEVIQTVKVQPAVVVKKKTPPPLPPPRPVTYNVATGQFQQAPIMSSEWQEDRFQFTDNTYLPPGIGETFTNGGYRR